MKPKYCISCKNENIKEIEGVLNYRCEDCGEEFETLDRQPLFGDD